MLILRRKFQLKTRIFFYAFLAIVLLSMVTEFSHVGEISHHGNMVFGHIEDSHIIKVPFYTIHLPQFEPVTIGGVDIDFSPTKHIVLFWAAALLLMLLLGYFYNRKEVIQQNFIAFILEDMMIFIRDSVVKPAFPHDYEKYTGYFLTFFFIILFNNYLGLVPLMSSATANLSITAGLAITAFIIQNLIVLYKSGPLGYFKQFMPISGMGKISGGIMNACMFPIEVFSLLVKPFSLAVRLYANILAGHAMLLTVFFMAYDLKTEHWNWMSAIPISALGSALGLLEILVCFIQAYVFTILSCIFLSSALNHDH